MRTRCDCLPCLLAACAFMSPAHADEYPSRAIKIVARIRPALPPTCSAARWRSTSQRSLGQPVMVENRPGANGIVADGVIAKSPTDGYTLLITSGAHIANAFVAKTLPSMC